MSDIITNYLGNGCYITKYFSLAYYNNPDGFPKFTGINYDRLKRFKYGDSVEMKIDYAADYGSDGKFKFR